MTESKTDNTEPIVSNVQTNILESEKINVPSSEIDYALLSVWKAKDSDGTSLNPQKETSLFLDTSLSKTIDKDQESIEKKASSKSKPDNTEPIVSDVQTNILESEKINVPSSENDYALLSVLQPT